MRIEVMPLKTHLSDILPAGAKFSSNPSSLPNQDSTAVRIARESKVASPCPREASSSREAVMGGRGDPEEVGFNWEQLR